MSALVEDLARVGTEIKGPTALGEDPRRLWTLAWALAVTEFRLRFFGSALGYLWNLMRPLLLFGVLYAVFSTLISTNVHVRFYPVALLLGVVLFGFFNEATSGCVRSLVNRENLVRKIDFPRLAVPLAVVLTAIFNLGLALVPVLIFLLASGGVPQLSWLELPFLIVGLALFSLALGLILSALFVRYRDIEPIWDVIMQITFYASPIFYPIEVVIEKGHGTVAHLMMISPFAVVLQQSRHAFVDHSHMNAAAAIGGGVRLLAPLALFVLIAAIGYRVFSREAPRIAEEL